MRRVEKRKKELGRGGSRWGKLTTCVAGVEFCHICCKTFVWVSLTDRIWCRSFYGGRFKALNFQSCQNWRKSPTKHSCEVSTCLSLCFCNFLLGLHYLWLSGKLRTGTAIWQSYERLRMVPKGCGRFDDAERIQVHS